MPPKTRAHIKIAAMVVAICWVAGYAKKSGQEAVPETRDTLTVTSDTLSETFDALSEIPNTLTDKRDGKTYKTVTIGKQTWMAKNLNYAALSGSWCYNDSLSYCKKYGRLYDWNTAKTVCPTGWHLPSRAEWNKLENYVGSSAAGTKLKSTSGWYDWDGNNSDNGTDEYGFSALPGGRRLSDGSFDNAGRNGNWWTATEDSSDDAYYRRTYYDDGNLYENDNYKEYGYAVRCVQNR